MRNLVPLLTARGTDANVEEADLLRDEVQRLYRVASDLRAAAERVRALHADAKELGAWCRKCCTMSPCSTLRALDGDA